MSTTKTNPLDGQLVQVYHLITCELRDGCELAARLDQQLEDLLVAQAGRLLQMPSGQIIRQAMLARITKRRMRGKPARDVYFLDGRPMLSVRMPCSIVTSIEFGTWHRLVLYYSIL